MERPDQEEQETYEGNNAACDVLSHREQIASDQDHQHLPGKDRVEYDRRKYSEIAQQPNDTGKDQYGADVCIPSTVE